MLLQFFHNEKLPFVENLFLRIFNLKFSSLTDPSGSEEDQGQPYAQCRATAANVKTYLVLNLKLF